MTDEKPRENSGDEREQALSYQQAVELLAKLLAPVRRGRGYRQDRVQADPVDPLHRRHRAAPVQPRRHSRADMLAECEAHGIGFIPYRPLEAGRLAQPGGPVAATAKRHGATPGQVALAWLLACSSVIWCTPCALACTVRLCLSGTVVSTSPLSRTTHGSWPAWRSARMSRRGPCLARLLSSALDEADPDASRITEILDGIPGAWERAQESIEQARRGETVPLSEL